MMFKFLILVHVSAAFPFKCPEPAQWSIRARGHCPDPSKYFCLKNDLIKSFSENCTVFDFQQPGRKGVLRGGLDADICSADRYHPWPIKYYTNVSTGCIFLKSECNEEGQVIYGHGNRNIDVSCRCDFSLGYDFIVKPRQPCFCVPSEEDCSCYVKTCIDVNHMLSPDYQCIHVMNTSIAHCKQISKERIDSEENQNQTHNAKKISRKENITPSASWKTCVGITVTAIFSGLISVYCIHKLIHNFCRKEQPVQSVREETVLGSSESAFLEFKDDLITSTILDKEILEFLIRKCVLIADDKAIIKSCQTQSSRNQMLLDILMLRPYNSFKVFVEAIKRSNQNYRHAHLFERMNAKVEDSNVLLDDEQLLIIGKRFRTRIRNGMNDSMIYKIHKWEKDDSCFFINTKATKYVFDQINKHNCVSVVGSSGSGKSTLVRHVALQMEIKGYTILPVTDAKEIRELFKPSRKTLYIVDNMCGNFTANQERLEEWKKEIKDIEGFLENKHCKLILTCRLQVFQDKGFNYLKIFKKNECNLGSESLSLQQEEKHYMTLMYFKEHASKAMEHLGKLEILPFLCKIYHVQQNKPQFNLELFLIDPFSYYKEELTSMFSDCKEGKYKYCALLLLVIFNNKLAKEILTGNDPKIHEMIEDINEVCEIDDHITGKKLDTELDVFKGTFVICDQGFYKTIHDKLFDFLAFYFGTQNKIIDVLIKQANASFLSERFVVTDKHTTGNNESANFVIPVYDDKLQVYIKRTFDDMVNSPNVNFFIWNNRNFESVKFSTRLLDYMKNLDKEQISNLIKISSSDFFNTIFILRENEIKVRFKQWFREKKCYGIVIPDDLMQQYIEGWLFHLTKANRLEDFMDKSNPMMNVTFRIALRTYMRQLTTEQIVSIIHNGSEDFLTKMFVMTEDAINESAKYTHECIGIVLPVILIQQYIEKWFDYLLIQNTRVSSFVNNTRLLISVEFRNYLRNHMKNLRKNEIESFIQNGSKYLLDVMFVMSRNDTRNYSYNGYECFGYVISDNLLQQYIKRWFLELTKDEYLYVNYCRPLLNLSFRAHLRSYMRNLTTHTIVSLIRNVNIDFLNTMFVMSENDIKDDAKYGYECIGIVIPDELLHLYIERWYVGWKSNDHRSTYNRLFTNGKFRGALRSFMRELKTEQIAPLIEKGTSDLFNRIFVMTEDDITDNNLYESIGIVIPDVLLKQYIERWFDEFTKTDKLTTRMNKSRLLENKTFRTALQSFITELDMLTVASLIKSGNNSLFNRMFVMNYDDIKDNDENILESFGILIPCDMLQQYIKRWFNSFTEGSLIYNESRPCRNAEYVSAVRTYMSQLDTETIASLIQTKNKDLFYSTFVLSEADIKETDNDIYQLFIICIPSDMLQQYIERWIGNLTNIERLEEIMTMSRPFRSDTFRSAVRMHMTQLDIKTIASLIRSGSNDFLNRMFVMAEDEIIKDNHKDTYDCVGIVIPDCLFQQYMERWFELFTKTNQFKYFMNNSRLLKNKGFRSALSKYMKQLNTDEIISVIQSGHDYFLNRMFVMTENDINDNGGNQCECFGIVVNDDILHTYIERWFQSLTKTNCVNTFMRACRPLKHNAFRRALRSFTGQLNEETIGFLLMCSNEDFYDKMFVLKDNYIKHFSENDYECFGIVVSVDLFYLYLQRWFTCKKNNFFERLNNSLMIQNNKHESRQGMDFRFRYALSTYIRQESIHLLTIGGSEFFNCMIAMTQDEINQDDENADILKTYNKMIELWFDGLTKSHHIEEFIDDSKYCCSASIPRDFMSCRFRDTLRAYMRQLSKEKIAYLIQTGSKELFNKVFVMTEDEIKDDGANGYQWFGIVIPDNMLQQYIKRLFYELTETNSVTKSIDYNRPMKNTTFRREFCTYMRKLSADEIKPLIQDANDDFMITVFVMKEEDIIVNNEDQGQDQAQNFGVVIPEEMVSHYLARWFQSLTDTYDVKKFINESKQLMKYTFQTALLSYMGKLSKDTIASLIKTGSNDFLNIMFVQTADDVKYNAENRYECFGIVIPDDLLKLFIERWFHHLTNSNQAKEFVNSSRLLKTVSFRTAIRSYIKQQDMGEMVNFIETVSEEVFERLFLVKEDDFQDHGGNSEILQYFIAIWFENVVKTKELKTYINEHRYLTSDIFRTALRNYVKKLSTEKIASLIEEQSEELFSTLFVMTEDDIKDNSYNRYEGFGIVIPEDLLQRYIVRWFEILTKSQVEKFMNRNRPLMNISFRTALRSFIGLLSTENIGSLIRTASQSFIDTMFVMSEEDINDIDGNRYECVGIVIPKDLLNQYIQRWLQPLTTLVSGGLIEIYIDKNRPLRNVTFRDVVRSYMRQLSTETIISLIRDADGTFLNTMFVMTENDNANIRHEWFGIIIPDDLLQQYIEHWFECLTKTNEIKIFFDRSRPLINAKFRIALSDFMKKLNKNKIALLIDKTKHGDNTTNDENTTNDFFDKMFVLTADDIHDIAEDRYECYGIVIPDDLLLQYIKRWFARLSEVSHWTEFINVSRPVMNKSFLTSVLTYTRNLDTNKITRLIQTGCKEFLSSIFVIKEDDIKGNTEHRHECFGIVIPANLLQQYMKRWFKCLIGSSQIEKLLNSNRLFYSFCLTFCSYMQTFSRKKIASLILTGSSDFLNTMFVMTYDDIKQEAENRLERVGIVIPRDLLQQYITRWFVHLSHTRNKKQYLKRCRPCNSISFRTAVRNYLGHFNTVKMSYLIKIVVNEDVFERIFADDDIKQNDENYDMLSYYIDMWFDYLTKTGRLKELNDCKHLKSDIFCKNLRSFIRKMKTEKIDFLIQYANRDFVNLMFVISDVDIQYNTEDQFECFGIIVPDRMVEKYIHKWFDLLSNTLNVKKFMNESRPLMHETFTKALRIFMKQLDIETVASLIKTGSMDFLNTMFVMTDDDIKDIADNRYESFGIVIPDNLLLIYISKWFNGMPELLDDITEATGLVKEYINENRPLMNETFRNALRTMLGEKNTTEFAAFARYKAAAILNIIFVMGEDDIKDNSEYRYECFGWAIPDNMLHQYIEIWFNTVIHTNPLIEYVNNNRTMMTVTFQNALRNYLKQLDIEQVFALIQGKGKDFLNMFFVTTEKDIKHSAENQYECVGIVIPSELLHEYIERWLNLTAFEPDFTSIKEEMNINRPLKNDAFRTALCTYIRRLSHKDIEKIIRDGRTDFINTMFVLTEDDIKENAKNQYADIGFIIPDCLLQHYTERWFEGLSHATSVKEYINLNRPLTNGTYQTQLQSYIRQFDEQKIGTFIQKGSEDFINSLFVISNNDIKENSESRYESFGIVIPDTLLQQYIGRWFNDMMKTDSVKEYLNASRCSINVTFRKALRTFIRQITDEKIKSLIQTGGRDFLNTMFVFSDNEIKENAVNRYERFGIVIPLGLLHQYIERLFNSLTQNNSVTECINRNRLMLNARGRTEMQFYIRQMHKERVETLIHKVSRDFINTMFVMTEKDIQDNTEDQSEGFGIFLPGDLLQLYIGRLFDGLTNADSVKKSIDANRCFRNTTFQISLHTYIKQLTQGQIGNLIRRGSRDFVNTMFVLSANDITENAENRYECFGIVIPEGTLHQYVERWFDSMTKTHSAKQYINENRIFMNCKFQATLDSYVNEIKAEKIAYLNRKGNIDILNTRRNRFKETCETKC